MKNKLLSILTLLIFAVSPTLAMDYGINTGDKLNLYTAAIVVRDDYLDTRNKVKAVATLPIGTEVIVKSLNNDWTYIEWFSKTSNKYKSAWASTTALCVSSGACSIEKTMGRIGGQMHETKYTNEAYDLMKNGNYLQAIEKATTGLNALFSVISIKNDSNFPDIDERIAFGFFVRGSSYAMLNESHQAIKDLTESINYKVLNSSYAMRGLNYEKLGYYSKAKADFIKAKQTAIAEQNEEQIIYLNERIKNLDILINKAKQIK